MFRLKKKTSEATHPGLEAPEAGRRITVWIYSLAALVIFLSTASLTFIAHMAWGEADRQRKLNALLSVSVVFAR